MTNYVIAFVEIIIPHQQVVDPFQPLVSCSCAVPPYVVLSDEAVIPEELSVVVLVVPSHPSEELFSLQKIRNGTHATEPFTKKMFEHFSNLFDATVAGK